MFCLRIFTPGGDKTIRFRITYVSYYTNTVALCILVSGAGVSWDFFYDGIVLFCVVYVQGSCTISSDLLKANGQMEWRVNREYVIMVMLRCARLRESVFSMIRIRRSAPCHLIAVMTPDLRG